MWLSKKLLKPTSKLVKMEKQAILILTVILTNLEDQLQCTGAAEFVSKTLRDLLFVLIVLITAENMYCIHKSSKWYSRC